MADQIPLTITEHDVQDKNLLLRWARKVGTALSGLTQRITAVEAAPKPLTPAEISRQLSATGSAPLNVQNLLGTLRQPQVPGAQRFTSVPAGQTLQQLQDTSLFLVQSSTTTYDLYTVIGGNPNVPVRLISNLSTSFVGSTSTNLMTLDTVQTSTGAKVLQGQWNHVGNVLFATSTLETPQRITHTVGSDGPVAAFPTLAVRDVLVVENNQNNFQAIVKGSSANQAGFNIYISGSTAARSFLRDIADVWTLNAAGTTIFTASTGVIDLKTTSVTIDNTITSYHGLNTAGEGVPYILYNNVITGNTSNLAAQTMYTTTAAGMYRANYYAFTTATGTGGNVALTLRWQDDLGSKSVSSNFNLGVNTFTNNSQYIRSASGLAITVEAGAATLTAGGYTVAATLERIS